jgi:hypothetical protein
MVTAWLLASAAPAKPIWEPVTIQDFAARASSIDSLAGAEVLFSKTQVSDAYTSGRYYSTREHYVRVRLFTEAAAQRWAQVTLPTMGDNVRVSEVSGRTIQPDGAILPLDALSVVERTVVELRGRKVRSVSFALPGVRAGAIIEYQFREVDLDVLTTFQPLPLQLDLPARLIRYRVRPLHMPGVTLRQLSFNATVPPGWADDDGFTTYELRDVPAFVSEPLMPPASHLRASLVLSYSTQLRVTPRAFWSAQGREAADLFKHRVLVNDELRSVCASTIAGTSDDDERLRRLVAWCRREIAPMESSDPDTLKARNMVQNWDARFTFRQRAGSSRDLTVLFAALAMAAGYPVRCVLVPDVDEVKFDQEAMDPRFLRTWNVAVWVRDRWQCFCPAERRLPWDMVPANEEGQLGLMCDDDSSEFIETPLAPPARSMRRCRADLTLDPDGGLAGELRVELSGHWNAYARSALAVAADTATGFREIMEWAGDGFELRDLRFDAGASADQPLVARARVRMEEHVNLAERHMLLEPTAWWAHRQPELTAPERKWPVCFRFAGCEQDTIRIHLPEGWVLDAFDTPSPVPGDGIAGYALGLRVADAGRVLECTRTFQFGEGGILELPPERYPDIKRLFDRVLDQDRTSVILTRTLKSR